MHPALSHGAPPLLAVCPASSPPLHRATTPGSCPTPHGAVPPPLHGAPPHPVRRRGVASTRGAWWGRCFGQLGPRPPGGCEEWLRRRNAPGLRAVRAPGEPRLLRKAGPPPARAAGQVRPTRGGGGESAGPRVRRSPASGSFLLPPPAVPLGPGPVPRRPPPPPPPPRLELPEGPGGRSLPETPPYGQCPAGACGRVTECAQK